MPGDYFQLTIATYNKTAEKYILKVQKYAPQPEREKFISLVKPGGQILDAGCGSGRDANYFASLGFRVTGIDLSTGLLSYARKHAHKNATFFEMDLRNMMFTTPFDGIWACASLLHLTREDAGSVLRTFYSLLAPGGTLFLLLKAGMGEKLVTSGTIEGDVRFFTYYTREGISTMLDDAGFELFDQSVWDQKDRHNERPHEIWISSFAKK